MMWDAITSLPTLLSFSATLLSAALAIVVFLRAPRVLAYKTLATGMAVLALEAALSGLSIRAVSYADVVRWQQWRCAAGAFVPGCWLLFSLCFARIDAEAFIAAWYRVLAAVFVLPLVLVLVFTQSLFIDIPVLDTSSRWVLGLAWAGYCYFLFLLLSSVLILVNLEQTLRASSGSLRWQIKFMILGVGSFFAVRIYISSQALLFSSLTSTLGVIHAGALAVATLLIGVSLVRSRFIQTAVYVSQTVLYNALTVLIVGVYLFAVGGLTQLLRYLGGGQSLPVKAFFIFLALLGLAIVLLSDELRHRSKLFLSRHLQRPRYDYRKEWTRFTQQTMSLLDRQGLCSIVVKMISETFGVAGVSIWFWDDVRKQLMLGGSTIFPETQASRLKMTGDDAAHFVRYMRSQPLPTAWDLERQGRGENACNFSPHLLREAHIRCSVSLVAAGEFLGILTLDDRLTKEPFSSEDFDLLKTIADQTASTLLNLRLSEHQVEARELEAFQTLSAFFLHDLKNLAATLSLTVQNLPRHYDDPEFRRDALRVIGNSVEKINGLCGRLASLGKKLELQRVDTDFNVLVMHTLADLNGAVQAKLVQDLRPVPRLNLDPEQVQKVLVNLILNANEAAGPAGEVRVAIFHEKGWNTLQVSDNGCGMSKDFMERSLFRPFQTTKSRGLGIGLYQSKAIIEAHHGRIEVESEEGKGSTFRVFLPVVPSDTVHYGTLG